MNIYKVEKALVPYRGGNLEERYFLTQNSIPIMTICDWLDTVSLNSSLTGKEYAKVMKKYLEFLDEISFTYRQVTNKRIIYSYIKRLMYMTKDKIFTKSGNRSYHSIRRQISIIKTFYLWLDEHINGLIDRIRGLTGTMTMLI